MVEEEEEVVAVVERAETRERWVLVREMNAVGQKIHFSRKK